MNLHPIDVSIIGGYLALCLAIGFFKFGKIKNIRDYTLGNKPFSTPVLIATTFATAVSARQIIGNVGKVYELGLVFIIPLVFVPISWWLTAKIFAPNLKLFHKHKFMSLSDIMEHWYGGYGRWITNIFSIVLTMGVTATSTLAIGYLLHYFLNIPQNMGMVIGVGIVALYSAFGGILSVVFTDVFQFFIFFIALPLACAFGYYESGGLKNIIASLPNKHVSINTDNILMFLSLTFYALVPRSSIPFVQRALIAKNEKQFKTAFIKVGFLMIPILLIVCLIGVISYKFNPNISPNVALYYFINHHLSPGMKGLMIAGLLSVIMSTQDSFLNSTSSLMSHDICKQLWPSLTDRRELIIARISCVLIAVISTSLLLLQKSIIEIVWLTNNFWMPLITFPLLAGLVGVRIGKKSFLTLVLASLSTVIITRSITGTFDTRSLTVGIMTSVIILYLANKNYKKSHPELVDMVFPKEKLLVRLKNNAFSNKLQLGSIYIFCTLMLLGYAVSTFSFPQLWVMKNSIFYLQSAAGVVCLLMLLNEIWVDADKKPKYLVLSWHFILCFCLPFLSGYVMFVYGTKATMLGKVLLAVNCMLSVALLRVLSNTVMSAVLAFVGIGLGYVWFSVDNVAPRLDYNMFAICSMGFMSIAMVIFLHNKKYVEKRVAAALETRVFDQAKEVNKALKAKKTFLNDINHEMRTPVHGVTNLIAHLDEEWGSLQEEMKREIVKTIRSCDHRFTSLCNNILDLAKFKKGEKKLEMGKCDIDKLLTRFRGEYCYRTVLDKISIKKADDLSEIEFCDETEILRVIKSFVDNALQYGKAPIIMEFAKQGKNGIRVSVSDEGQGIPANELEKIFEPFEESSRTKTKAGGRGVSLAVCTEIIKAHKGRIWAENKKGGGSIFSFIIPLSVCI